VIYAGCEAIFNALVDNQKSTEGAIMYTNLFPGSRDALLIQRAKIKELVYLEVKTEWEKRHHLDSAKMILEGKVICRYTHSL